jgi:protease-4
MKALFRLCAVVASVCLIVVLLTFLVQFIRKVWFGAPSAHSGQVVIVDLNGIILSSTKTIQEIDEIIENHTAKALVIRISSPGGLVGPSQELFQAIRRADSKIPVVASIGSLGASGGYYAALGARKIFCNPGAMTASIGVIMELMDISHLLQWAKVNRFTIKAGKFKDVGNPNRAMTPEEHALLDTLLADVHRQFRGDVKERRKLTDAQLENTADGRVMTGAQAKVAGLIDATGGLEEALLEAKKLAGLPADAQVTYPDTGGGLLRRVLGADSENRFDGILNLLEGAPLSLTPTWRILLLSPVQ